MRIFGDWKNSCLCLEDGIKPATADLINLQSIYSNCLEGEYMVFKKGNIPWNKGKTNVYSEEVRKNMSDSTKGQIPWNLDKSKYKLDNKVIYCACGCGEQILSIDKYGRSRTFVFGHGNRGKKRTAETRLKLSIAKQNMSDETRRRISESKKGIKPSEESNKKNSESNKGRIVSDETRKKMSVTRMGYKHSEISKRKMSISHKGMIDGKNNPMYGVQLTCEKHHNWQGGISFEPYCPKFNNELKERIRNEYNRNCFLCGKKENGRKHSVHHIDYNKNQGCGRYEWKLVPLCTSCHTKTNYNREYWQNIISDKLICNEYIEQCLEYNNFIYTDII